MLQLRMFEPLTWLLSELPTERAKLETYLDREPYFDEAQG